ncbi:transcriptional regulator GlxA family with amidase domain [Kitasatospora sp. GP30]|uniref:GlxA family transcriptional regulator n=1 Tax=Kitasatospora sp. GP30 TaxID=3035084 RepID=UPI000C705B2A|nr:helix-turn-helix domain-containing protein [Kitasatospora sp. GP30]MDH6142819.1 transcriptional regulator GlxA family with amidase domain [Kitasatospora sp. GP30]
MRIAVLVLDDVFDSGLTAVLDVFKTANNLRGCIPQPPPPWDLTRVGFTSTVRTSCGLLVGTEPVARAADCDLLLVPAVSTPFPHGLAPWLESEGTARARELVARTRVRGAQLAGACTSTFLLADSGVLDGLRATTAWQLAPLFRERYPKVALDEQRMVTHSDGITTAGAAFSAVDLALSLVRRSSPSLSDLVAGRLIIEERPTQATHSMPTALADRDATTAAFEAWVRCHLNRPVTLTDAAHAIGVSKRTLQRRTRSVLGISPVRFIQDLRIEQATHLLRSTDEPIDVIARRVGYETASTLRMLLRTRTGRTAGQLRGRRHAG